MMDQLQRKQWRMSWQVAVFIEETGVKLGTPTVDTAICTAETRKSGR
jgi:hypothetical protein